MIEQGRIIYGQLGFGGRKHGGIKTDLAGNGLQGGLLCLRRADRRRCVERSIGGCLAVRAHDAVAGIELHNHFAAYDRHSFV